MKLLTRISERIRASLLDDASRYHLQFVCVYGTLCLIAAVMTGLNIITGKGALTYATLGYSLFCGAAFLLLLKNKIGLRFSKIAFAVSFYILFTFFIISGNPDGFSVLWICLLPSLGLLTFGRRDGSFVCAGMLALLIFFFYTPFGRSLLRYEYSATFQMRFPLLYIAFFAIGYFLETVRVLTYNKLQETQELYCYLYSHDALTQVTAGTVLTSGWTGTSAASRKAWRSSFWTSTTLRRSTTAADTSRATECSGRLRR